MRRVLLLATLVVVAVVAVGALTLIFTPLATAPSAALHHLVILLSASSGSPSNVCSGGVPTGC